MQDGSLIFKGQCAGRVHVVFVFRDRVIFRTDYKTLPYQIPRQIMTNQQSAFVGVATISWNPTDGGISAKTG